MENLFRRFLRLNAALLEELFQRAADGLHALLPESPLSGVSIFHTEEGASMASVEVSDTAAPLSAAVKFLDSHGHETTADDVPQCSSSDEAVATVSAADHGLSATVTIVALGVTLIDATTTNYDGTFAAAQGMLTVKPATPFSARQPHRGRGPGRGSSAEEPPAEEAPVRVPS